MYVVVTKNHPPQGCFNNEPQVVYTYILIVGFKLACTKVQRAIIVTLTSASAHTLKFFVKVFYVMGKALSGELSSMETGLVVLCSSFLSNL